MTALSYAERQIRRGALSEGEFLDNMRNVGFRVLAARPGFLWEFSHQDLPGHRFTMKERPVESYNAAWPRLKAELDRLKRVR